jgi:hypothetical protein
MANLRVFKFIANDVFTVRFIFDPSSISDTDRRLVKEFGEPSINVGGTFTAGGETVVIPEKFVRVFSGFPYQYGFDAKDPEIGTAASDLANLYADQIVLRLQSVLTNLRQNNTLSSSFSSESVISV